MMFYVFRMNFVAVNVAGGACVERALLASACGCTLCGMCVGCGRQSWRNFCVCSWAITFYVFRKKSARFGCGGAARDPCLLVLGAGRGDA